MACYCGQSRRGVWDVRGILHTASECHPLTTPSTPDWPTTTTTRKENPHG